MFHRRRSLEGRRNTVRVFSSFVPRIQRGAPGEHAEALLELFERLYRVRETSGGNAGQMPARLQAGNTLWRLVRQRLIAAGREIEPYTWDEIDDMLEGDDG